MKAIETTFHGPTNTRGSRITASDSDGNRATVPYEYVSRGEEAHRAAAVALCRKMGWGGCDRLISGGTKRGFVFVFAPESCKCAESAFQGLRRRR